MKKIYVCTEGDYSDYHICGVFDNKELAEKFCKTFDCQIEEWDLNPFSVELKRGYSQYWVRMNKDGETLGCTMKNRYTDETKVTPRFDSKGNMYIFCMAKSGEHAIKIANEHRAALIASNQWGS